MAAKPLAVCPEDLCAQKKWGKGKVSKKISAGAGLIFKGSGFYITDYRSEGYKEAAKKEAATTKPAGESSAKPAESKPVAKTEAKVKSTKAKAD